VTISNTYDYLVTPLQAAILELIWSQGPSTADAVRTALHPAHPLKDSSVRTLLRRLEAHGYLHHRVVGKTFVYDARLSRHRVAATAVRQVIDRFCSGSVEQLLVCLEAEGTLSAAEVERVIGPAGTESRPQLSKKERKKEEKRRKRKKRKPPKPSSPGPF
jgi:BlaI family penicillinase repressor